MIKLHSPKLEERKKMVFNLAQYHLHIKIANLILHILKLTLQNLFSQPEISSACVYI